MAQPANTAISIFPRLRTIRNHGRHTSIKHLTTPFDGMLVPAPGEENQVLEVRDQNDKSDAFRFGRPVSVQPRAYPTIAAVYAGVSDLDFPVRLPGNPREVYIQKAASNVADDLHAEVRAVSTGAADSVTAQGI